MEQRSLRLPKDQSRTVEIRLASESTKMEEERMAVMGGDLYEVVAAWYKHRLKFHPDCCWVYHLKGREAGRRLLEHHERKHGRSEQLVNSSGSERSADKTKAP